MSTAFDISVVIEGYNAGRGLGSLRETLEALRGQDFDLKRVEVILVTADPPPDGADAYSGTADFGGLRWLHCPGAHYYALKNAGAGQARGRIVALLDSDTVPARGWLAAIAAGFAAGARVQAGVTCFGTCERSAARWLNLIAASISWGFIIPDVCETGAPAARGFLSHNVAFERILLQSIGYRSDLGRTCAGSFLEHELAARDITIRFAPAQRVHHAFDLRWWLLRLHVRFGHELHLLKQIDARARHRWTRWLGPCQPLAMLAWHVVLDVPQWRRTCRARKVHPLQAAALLPVLLVFSCGARTAEAAGMAATRLWPSAMHAFAARN